LQTPVPCYAFVFMVKDGMAAKLFPKDSLETVKDSVVIDRFKVNGQYEQLKASREDLTLLIVTALANDGPVSDWAHSLSELACWHQADLMASIKKEQLAYPDAIFSQKFLIKAAR